ncbi:MAG: nitrilase-related carbon-nitrogen hydrolase, partial [Opitutales bacterium]
LVGPVGSFKKGNEVKTFTVNSKRNESIPLKIGPLICYEDIFPRLCRETALSGVDLFFVTTNDAWFGEEGCAEQHAAHSVLRAIETQTPFLRCGNAGWSGWIDPNGYQREVLRDGAGSIYFEGATVLNLSIYPQKISFYVRYGDWFAYFCLIITFLLCMLLFRKNQNNDYLV